MFFVCWCTFASLHNGDQCHVLHKPHKPDFITFISLCLSHTFVTFAYLIFFLGTCYLQASSLLLGWLILEIWMILWLSSQRREEVSLSCVNIATILLIFSPKASITSVIQQLLLPTPSNQATFIPTFFIARVLIWEVNCHWYCHHAKYCYNNNEREHFPSMIQIWPAPSLELSFTLTSVKSYVKTFKPSLQQCLQQQIYNTATVHWRLAKNGF